MKNKIEYAKIKHHTKKAGTPVNLPGVGFTHIEEDGTLEVPTDVIESLAPFGWSLVEEKEGKGDGDDLNEDHDGEDSAEMREKITNMTVEELIAFIEASGPHTELAGWEKYKASQKTLAKFVIKKLF